MMMKKCLPLLLLLPVLLLGSCSVQRDIRKADKHYGYGEYVEAAGIYSKAYKRIESSDKDTRAQVAYRQGECYRLTNQSVKAENAYVKAIRYHYPSDTVYLRYAQTLHKNGKYKPATTNYGVFLDGHPDDVQALNGLFACMKMEEWKELPKTYKVRKSPVLNLKRGNFCPILLPVEYKTVIFSSSATLKEGSKPSKITGLPDNDFYMAKQDQFGAWEKPEVVEGPINSDFDEGVGCIDMDGKNLYFTRCVTKSDSDGSNSRAGIFRSTKSGEQWSEPQLMEISKDTTLWFAHPAVSPDGRYLYYVSELPGGYGGKDIWRSEIMDNIFGPAENLGPEINTPGDEMFPYFRSTGEFYFSSTGLPGLGGLDIFKAEWNKRDSVWQVENMLELNSSADDFGIAFFGKEERGLFSSNRKEAKGIDKIYEFGEASRLVEVSGLVTDRDGEPIADAIIRLVNDKGTNTKIKSRRDGTYSYEIEKDAQYAMLGTARGYLNSGCQFYSKDKDTSYVQNFVLTSLHLPVRLENIFFEFNHWELKPESGPALDELVKLLLDNPHVTIEIGAHTDRKGTEEYNENLSRKRAQSVVDYVVAAGIEAERLTAKGYGKSKPVKVTEAMATEYPFLKDGDILSEEFVETLSLPQQDVCDQINRRCEFKVLKTTYRLF